MEQFIVKVDFDYKEEKYNLQNSNIIILTNVEPDIILEEQIKLKIVNYYKNNYSKNIYNIKIKKITNLKYLKY